MTMQNEHSMLAIDVGSSCAKLGWFPTGNGACASDKPASNFPIAAPLLPTPQERIQVRHKDRSAADWLAEVERWIDELPAIANTDCALASVHASAGGALEESLRLRPYRRCIRVTSSNVGIEARVKEPVRVGVDRLLAALAINQLRRPDSPAISVDMGTATTVDLIAADGSFEGGAILAGPMLSLSALHGATSSLPRLAGDLLTQPPAAVGKSTSQAMAAGAYWGAVGAVRELVTRLAEQCATAPELYLTGGAADDFAEQLAQGDRPLRHVPHMVLAGIRLAAQRIAAST
jgi:type III pantothenate kinase